MSLVASAAALAGTADLGFPRTERSLVHVAELGVERTVLCELGDLRLRAAGATFARQVRDLAVLQERIIGYRQVRAGGQRHQQERRHRGTPD